LKTRIHTNRKIFISLFLITNLRVKKGVKLKSSWHPYTTDLQKLSIYPKTQTDNTLIGKTITLVIKDIDENGNGIGTYNGMRVIIPRAELGMKVKAKIKRVNKDTIYAQLVETEDELVEN